MRAGRKCTLSALVVGGVIAAALSGSPPAFSDTGSDADRACIDRAGVPTVGLERTAATSSTAPALVERAQPAPGGPAVCGAAARLR